KSQRFHLKTSKGRIAAPLRRGLLEPAARGFGRGRIGWVLRIARITQCRRDRRDADLAKACVELGALASLLGARSSGFHFPLQRLLLPVPGLKGRVSRFRLRRKWAETLPSRGVFGSDSTPATAARGMKMSAMLKRLRQTR